MNPAARAVMAPAALMRRDTRPKRNTAANGGAKKAFMVCMYSKRLPLSPAIIQARQIPASSVTVEVAMPTRTSSRSPAARRNQRR